MNAMPNPDLSVVVTAHSEGLLLRPTLRSVTAAIDAAAAGGIVAELIVVLDNATLETTNQVQRWISGSPDAEVRSIEVSTGGPAGARAAGIEAARGEFIALIDGDDLVSENYLIEGVRTVRGHKVDTVVHPETLISFGSLRSRWRVMPSSDPRLDFRDLISRNQWPSSMVARTELLRRHPPLNLPPGGPFGPEDWTWNLAVLAAGVDHEVAPETVFFYRTRETAGVNNKNAYAVLPPLDLESLRARFPVTRNPVPTAPTRRAAMEVGRGIVAAGKAAVAPMPEWFKKPIRDRYYGYRERVYRRRHDIDFREPEELRPYFLKAAQIEPALSWTVRDYEDLEKIGTLDEGYGDVLEQLEAAIRGRSDVLVLVPWIGIGGADLVSRNYLEAFIGMPELARRVSAVATYLPKRTVRELVPEGTNFFQVPPEIRRLHPERLQRLVAQAIVWAQPRIVVGINCFDLVHSLKRFAAPITAGRDVYLSLFAFDRLSEGYPVQAITDDEERIFLDRIAGIITDNPVTQLQLEGMLGLAPGFIRHHPQPVLDPTPAIRYATSAYRDEAFGADRPFRLLWPHRVDHEKRPESLIAIAELARERGLSIEIHVYGSVVLGGAGKEILSRLTDAGIIYDGPYSGGLASVPTDGFHAMLLTSAWEGMPLAVVESMMLSLPVIATSVGGVPALVEHRITGMLTAGPDDAEGFVDSISELIESAELRRGIIERGYAAAVESHSWERFRRLVQQEFRLSG